jgi:hypothetical protein
VVCGKVSEALMADASVVALFLHVVFGEEGDDMEHALRHGSFPVAKARLTNTRHEQVLHLDELTHGPQRKALTCADVCRRMLTYAAVC